MIDYNDGIDGTPDDAADVGDKIVVTAGLFEGTTGTVETYDRITDVYLLHLDNGQHAFAFRAMFEVLEDQMPELPQQGMTSEQLAEYVSDFIVACTSRVRGVGDEQYSEGSHQKFEAMSIDDLFEWAEEEVQDIAVYAAMLHIRLRRTREAFKGLV